MRAILPLVCCAVVSSAFAAVSVDWDKTVDFSNRHTFAWKKGTEAPNPLTEERLHQIIQMQLEAKGLHEVSDNPDLYVITHANANSGVRTDMSSFGYAGGSAWHGWDSWGPAATTAQIRDITIGTLVVDLLEPPGDKLIWRGVASETFNGPTEPDKVAKKIVNYTTKMFKEFPPPPAKPAK